MLLLALNGIFAMIFFAFARRAFGRAWPFLKLGWWVIDEEVKKSDYRRNIESRKVISQAGVFLVGGLLWLLAGMVSGGLSVYFSVELLRLYFA